MKQFMKVCGALLLALVLLTGAALADDAAVRYEGGAEKVVFLPGSSYSDSDLFANFKNVLPGDVIDQKITVSNNTGKQVRIYMRAEPVSDADKDFLDQLSLTVKSGDSAIFEGTAGEQDGLAKNTLLGTFKKDGSVELTATLTVPAELDNAYMGREGRVPWTFLVEEIPVDDTPQTGDWFSLPIWLALAAAAALVLAVAIVKNRRARKA